MQRANYNDSLLGEKGISSDDCSRCQPERAPSSPSVLSFPRFRVSLLYYPRAFAMAPARTKPVRACPPSKIIINPNKVAGDQHWLCATRIRQCFCFLIRLPYLAAHNRSSMSFKLVAWALICCRSHGGKRALLLHLILCGCPYKRDI